jgi:hypothetical protein
VLKLGRGVLVPDAWQGAGELAAFQFSPAGAGNAVTAGEAPILALL